MPFDLFRFLCSCTPQVCNQGFPALLGRPACPPVSLSLPDPDKELRDEVQKKTAHFVPLLNIALLIPGIMSSFIISSLSDHYGRRVAMGVLCIGLTSNAIISSFVILLELNINFLILACLMCGCFGGGLLTYSGQISVCFADITKIPSEEEQVLVNSKNRQASLERRRLLYLGVYDGICVLSSAGAVTVTGNSQSAMYTFDFWPILVL
ncbi:unnamed protein product [Trichobilharzia regenti]|nr:unnamed protein product [Trichobilharzia regenti]